MLTNDALLFVLISAGTLAFASLLRVTLAKDQDHPPPHLDARGLLLFVPLVVLLAAGASLSVLVPLMTGLAVYLLAALCTVLHLPRLIRVVLVLVAATVLFIHGVQIETFRIPFTGSVIALGWLSFPLTVAWLLACAVLFGRAGGIPSVAFGVAGITGVTFYIICLMVPWATGPAARTLALAVAAVGLMQLPRWGQVSHRPAAPSAYAMGFVIGALAVVGSLKHAAAIAALLPILLISVPLFGATYAYVSRLRGMRIGERRQHLHEVLLQRGYSARQVQLILLGLTAYMGALGLLVVTLIPQPAWLKALVLLLGLGFGPLFVYLILRMMRREPQGADVHDPLTIEMFNVRLHPVTMEQALARAEEFMREGRPRMIVTSDTSAVVRAQEDEELRTIINEADLATMDGQGVVLCARMLDFPVAGRVPGCDMMQHLCELCGRIGEPVALLGAEPGVAQEAARVLEQRYPGLRVVFEHHGYFDEDEEEHIIEGIREARPAALFVAMGIPKQEKWIKRHMQELQVPVCMGVGGTLDVVAGTVKRAPEWMQRCGLEWLYRTAMDPKRLPRLASLPRLFFWTIRAVLRPNGSETAPASHGDGTGVDSSRQAAR
ncbi:MAG: WecB/TagA/CpsF family glycosyltransferase, partial [Armatimonadota bacterium]